MLRDTKRIMNYAPMAKWIRVNKTNGKQILIHKDQIIHQIMVDKDWYVLKQINNKFILLNTKQWDLRDLKTNIIVF